jgi:hypothetical protein
MKNKKSRRRIKSLNRLSKTTKSNMKSKKLKNQWRNKNPSLKMVSDKRRAKNENGVYLNT